MLIPTHMTIMYISNYNIIFVIIQQFRSTTSYCQHKQVMYVLTC